LDNVFLRSGYTRQEIAGEMCTSVQDADELHREIALHLTLRKKNLRGQEIRFLRKYMDLTQAELGEWLGLSDQSIARYEKQESPFEGPADMLLRVLMVGKLTGALDPVELVERIRQSDGASRDDMVLEHTDHEWKVAA
jgi:DNA-binding transcriptional regulator YiaG